MKPMTREWAAKAEGDFATMERESRARKSPNYDAVCFHAQQCAEKYLKARLCEAGIAFAKVHDLVALLEQVLAVEPLWQIYRSGLAALTDYAVTFRYPGDSADRAAAQDAHRQCKIFRCAARAALGLKA
jgi:HEPN domain-containing protein